LAATTGLRRGELLGLCWDCVDLENGVITVQQRQLLVLKNGLSLEETTKAKAKKKRCFTRRYDKGTEGPQETAAQEKLLLGEAYQT